MTRGSVCSIVVERMPSEDQVMEFESRQALDFFPISFFLCLYFSVRALKLVYSDGATQEAV